MINSYKEFLDINTSSTINPTKKELIDLLLSDISKLTDEICKLFFMLSERERKIILINAWVDNRLLYRLNFSWSVIDFASCLASDIIKWAGDADKVLWLISNNQ